MSVTTGVSRCWDTFRLGLVKTSRKCQYAWITVMPGLTHARMITLVLRIGFSSLVLILPLLHVQLPTPVAHFVKYMEMASDSVTQYGQIIMFIPLTWTTVQWWSSTAACPIRTSNLRFLRVSVHQSWCLAHSTCMHQHFYFLQLISSKKFPLRDSWYYNNCGWQKQLVSS